MDICCFLNVVYVLDSHEYKKKILQFSHLKLNWNYSSEYV